MNKISKTHYKQIYHYNDFGDYNNYYNFFGFKQHHPKNNNINKQLSMNNNSHFINSNNIFNKEFNDNKEYYYTHSNKKKKFHKNNNNNYEEIKNEENFNEFNDDKNRNNELLKVKINVNGNQMEELVIYKDEDIYNLIVIFCKKNNIGEKFIMPLYNKIIQSLKKLNYLQNNMELNRNDIMVLNSARKYVENV